MKTSSPTSSTVWLLSLISLSLFACVATMGPYITPPNVPPGIVPPGDNLPVIVQVRPLKDMRLMESSVQDGSMTPDGDTSQIVTDALSKALKARGARIDFSSDVEVSGEIRSWSSVARGSTTGELKSEATIFIEVAQGGLRRFSGSFQGSRSSQFPLVTPQDIGDSLGLAMSQAIEQALSDPALRRALQY